MWWARACTILHKSWRHVLLKLPSPRKRLHLKFPTYPNERVEEAWLPRFPSLLDRFVGFIDKIRHMGTMFTFSSGVSVVSRLEKWPHKCFAYRHALEPDYSAYGGHFLRAPVCSLFSVCHLLIIFFSVTLGEETPIFVPLTLRRGVGGYSHGSLDGNLMATSEKITYIRLISAHIIER